MMIGAEFNELSVFLAVIEARSFRGAARRIGQDPSSISRAVARLEARLGTRLINRTTRSVSATDAGELLYARLVPTIGELDQALAEVAEFGGRPTGVVRLNLPRVAAELILIPLLPDFVSEHPGIMVEMVIDDALSDVIGEGFDAGIRVGTRLAQDAVAIRIGPDLRNAIVGTPDYFARHPQPGHPIDLRQHTCLNYRWAKTGEAFRWRFHDGDDTMDIDVHGPLTVNDTGVLLSICLAGLGVACLPEAMVAQLITEGRLQRVLKPYCRPFPGFYLYHSGRTRSPPALKALIAFLSKRVSS